MIIEQTETKCDALEELRLNLLERKARIDQMLQMIDELQYTKKVAA